MIKIFLLLLLATPTSPVVYLNSGTTRCGAIKRSVDTVQVWCWEGLAYADSTMILNSILKSKPDGVILSIGSKAGTAVYKFEQIEEYIIYTATGDNGEVVSGLLP